MAEFRVLYQEELVKPLNVLGYHYFIETNKQKLIDFYTNPNYPNKSIINVVNANYYLDDKPRSYYKLLELKVFFGIERAFVLGDLGELPIEKEKSPSNCIIAYETIAFNSYHYQEQEYAGAFLRQLLFVLQKLKVGGTAVFRIYEVYTPLMAHCVALLFRYFDMALFYKPKVSLAHKTDRLLICQKLEKEPPKEVIALLEEIIANGNFNILAIAHPDFNYDEIISDLQTTNHDLSLKQYIEINTMISYINKGNYYGEDYEEFKQRQEEFNSTYLK